MNKYIFIYVYKLVLAQIMYLLSVYISFTYALCIFDASSMCISFVVGVCFMHLSCIVVFMIYVFLFCSPRTAPAPPARVGRLIAITINRD